MPPGSTGGQSLVDDLLADPPVIHPMGGSEAAPMGVWSTDESCYRFIAARCGPDSRTLETGCGLSTVLFAGLGGAHICCTAGEDEAERVRTDVERRGLSGARVSYRVGSSHQSLPQLEASGTELDLVLIDGSHGFPLPVLDWFYAGSMLRQGGVLIVDDLNLPAVDDLARFVKRDPRWKRLELNRKWGAWEKLKAGTLSEDWTEQTFYTTPRRQIEHFGSRVVAKVRHTLRTRSL